ncbi:saccharopine dehydrogenase NADP-binding domain-containing protein [bacterium]|nr:saccharopine dehydrogenase NADP-binding domain-containing protein [candidate division CSSED10-310 bacterium]
MSEKKILLLGAGLVTQPLVDYLLNIPDFHLTIATRTVAKAEKMIKNHPRGLAQSLNVQNEELLEREIKNHDLTISLLPAQMHPVAARLCLKHKKHLMTTSYVSPAMKEFDSPAREAGLLFMNELGLDPGIDHMSAMRIIHAVENAGGKVVSFRSYCGGLPAPEANTNPFGYKFSWAPRGVILAARNDAKFLWNGELKEIEGKNLFLEYHHLTVDGMEFEAYPNRNSMPYQELYGLSDVHTMYRGTLRYKGWCTTLKAMVDLGFLDLTPRTFRDQTYAELFREQVDAKGGDIRAAASKLISLPPDHYAFDNMEWLGLMSRDNLPEDAECILDTLVHKCLEKLVYEPGERDMIVLHHVFGVTMNGMEKKITSTLVDFGVPYGQTAMARTVSLPAAIGTRLILQGKINATGVRIPVDPEMYHPILDELERLGIRCEEKGI